jgi:hypothetical protein
MTLISPHTTDNLPKGVTELEKDFTEFISVRCERALEEDVEYMRDEANETIDQDELQKRAEVLCYLKGFRDFAQLLGIDIDHEAIINGSHGSQKR